MSPRSDSPTVILVHGAWADGSSWNQVIADLQRAEVAVTAAPIPLTSLGEDVDALNRMIDRTSGPVILAAHAYAGAVIGATDHPRVRGLVSSPRWRPTKVRLFSTSSTAPIHTRRRPNLHPTIPAGSGCPAVLFRRRSLSRPVPSSARCWRRCNARSRCSVFSKPVPRPGWKQHPSWYLLAELDRMINPDTQRFMAERMQARIHSHDVDHAPLISRPQVVTDIVFKALKHVAADQLGSEGQ